MPPIGPADFRRTDSADVRGRRSLADTHIRSPSVLIAYLGQQTGSPVLASKIRRGTATLSRQLHGVCRSDVRGQQVIVKLDQIFNGLARAIAKHNGEILKIIGDGLLAIFPV
jgi:adenylate cyclase